MKKRQGVLNWHLFSHEASQKWINCYIVVFFKTPCRLSLSYLSSGHMYIINPMEANTFSSIIKSWLLLIFNNNHTF